MQRLFSLLALLLVIGLFFLGMVLGGEEKGPRDAGAPVSLPAVGSVRSSDRAALIALFGLPVSHSAAAGEGVVTDAPLGSINARLYRWQGEDGLEICAVRPAQAAQLLRREETDMQSASLWTVNDRTLMVNSASGGACAYYEDDDAAYSLFLAGADADQLLGRIAADVSFPSPNQAESR